jgi:hypothetical protein
MPRSIRTHSEYRPNRRQFLRGSALAIGAAALTGPLAMLKTKTMARAVDLAGTRGASPYGPLFPAKDMATGLELIMLPRGFQYTTFSWKGDRMSDGLVVPSGHDGMAIVASANPGGIRRGQSQVFTLIRNHEIFGVGGAPIAPTNNYDSIGSGGTIALQVENGKLLGHRVSISGTSSNCAGGPTPWGSWCTCEEGVNVGNVPHGYVFESTVDRVLNPTPLLAMGRFVHEAVAFDPSRGDVYLTEDNSASAGTGTRRRGNSGFYRFVPNKPLGGVGSLEAGGQLYMLKAKDPDTGAPIDDLRDPEIFAMYDVEWVPIPDPNAAPSGGLSGPYIQGRAGGATRFQRLEGCVWDPVRQIVTFNDTEGGPVGADAGRADRAEGSVWTYDPKWSTLTCIFVSQGALAPAAYGADNPDNVGISPNGGIILCEDGDEDDGDGLSLLGLMPNGQSYEFARNIINIRDSDAGALYANGHNPDVIGTGNFSGQEWAGPTFAPDGKTLFVNIQTPGLTFAITGPFGRGPF